MKKLGIIFALLLVLLISISSHVVEVNTEINKTEDVIVEEPVVLEHWMTIPFDSIS